jgi:hypothetical protein
MSSFISSRLVLTSASRHGIICSTSIVWHMASYCGLHIMCRGVIPIQPLLTPVVMCKTIDRVWIGDWIYWPL